MDDRTLLALMSAMIASGWVSSYNYKCLEDSNSDINRFCIHVAANLLVRIDKEYKHAKS